MSILEKDRYILISGGASTYPYSPAQLRADNPQTSFSSVMTPEGLAEWGVYPVAETEHPAYDAETQRMDEGAPALVGGVWTQTWVVTDLPPEEIAAALAQWRSTATVTRFQARAALHLAGLLDTVEAAVAGGDTITKLAWGDALNFERNSPTIAALASAINLTDAQIDDLFKRAAAITA